MKKINIGIIILNYNSSKDTILLVKDIEAQNPIHTHKIVIVDNNSNDGSIDKLNKEFSNNDLIDIIQTENNLGYGAGNNYGIKYIKNKYQIEFILVCNPDVKFNVNIIPDIIATFKINNLIAAVSIQMVNENNKKQLSAWKLPTLTDDIILSISILKKLIKNPIAYSNSLKPQCVDVLQGAFFIIKLKAFNEINGFDEDIFLYGEERILGHKLKKHGYKLYFLPKLKFTHKVGATINKKFHNKRSKYLILQNSRRHYHKKYLKKNWLSLLIFDFFTIIGYIEKLLIDFIKREN
ncbi:MAG: hypothetical protein CMG55_07600 [Candidatus Marinimicrobia bacterium]|nr:hypothetical protein [Candidatus Neomarinimicrobiota bacterium]|tara:strand:+ start:1576 stop:2454 length:879 start_codon:yes stop_codon:yes gene_type:complete